MDATKFCEYQQRVDLLHGLLDDQKLVSEPKATCNGLTKCGLTKTRIQISSTTRTLLQLRNAAVASARPNTEVVGGVDRILRIQRTAENDLREYLMEVCFCMRYSQTFNVGLNVKTQTKTQRVPEPKPTPSAPKVSLAEAREGSFW